MKRLCSAAAALGLLSAQLLAAPAIAQDDQATEQLASAKLAIAHQILEISYPEEVRVALFKKVGDAVGEQMIQSFRGSLDNPEVEKLLIDWQSDLAIEQESLLERHVPLLFEGWARAYAEIFSEKELKDILAFVSTESGKRFMLASADVVSNSHYTQASQAYLDEITKMTMARLPELVESLKALEVQGSDESASPPASR